MGSKLSTIYSSVGYFSAKKTCMCSSKYWKSYQMDLNIAVVLFRRTHEYPFVREQEVITVYFRCSNCEAEFPLSMYYFNGQFYQKCGHFKRNTTFNDRISTAFSYNSLKSILFILSQSNKVYTSENYAIDLYKTLLKD